MTNGDLKIDEVLFYTIDTHIFVEHIGIDCIDCLWNILKNNIEVVNDNYVKKGENSKIFIV